MIFRLFRPHQRRYGARRIVRDLAELRQCCGPVRVARLMNDLKPRAIQPRSFTPRATDSGHRFGYSPNLLLHSLLPRTANQVWVADIT